MTRFRAAGIHLFISGIIVITLMTLMFGLWYPDKYFKLMGGAGLIYLIVGIDLCLGPLLTLVVFKSGKKSLKFDLAIIAILQLSALIYGSYTMFISRPIFTAFADGTFSVATAAEVRNQDLALAPKAEWKHRSLTGPVLVGIVKPTNPKELDSVSFLATFGSGYARFPKYFVNYDSQRNEIFKASKPLSDLRKIDNANNAVIDSFLKDQERNEGDYVFIPIGSFFENMAAVLDAKSAEFVTILNAVPKVTSPIKTSNSPNDKK